MRLNVAQLLKESTGATRSITLDEPLLDQDGNALGDVTGELKLTKTDRGIWVSGKVAIEVADTCSRCLKRISITVPAKVDDEYLPPVDLVTGQRLRYDDEVEADTNSIDEHNELDLSETLRQYRLAGLPLAPLCKEDCKGICPQCGANLNEETHDCEPEMDPRWGKLRELLG